MKAGPEIFKASDFERAVIFGCDSADHCADAANDKLDQMRASGQLVLVPGDELRKMQRELDYLTHVRSYLEDQVEKLEVRISELVKGDNSNKEKDQ